VNAGANVTIVAGQTVQLQGTGDPGTYLWTPATGLSATNILNPLASPSITTTYTLTTTSSLGCTASDDVQVEIVPECAKPMNAITPNGDGINDKWLVTYGNCLSVASVKVFNRYGSPVFESDNYQNNWEGTYKGKTLPDGTYYYVINFKLNTGRVLTLRGDLTILR
jgi:gliding motility-associated-like protein